MKIAAIAMSRIPSLTANSIQVMKMCQALAQHGHELTLLVPDMPPLGAQRDWDSLAALYGLQTRFRIEWLPVLSRRFFPYRAVSRAAALKPDLLYTWPVQAAMFGLTKRLPVLQEMHEPPQGIFGPYWYRLFMKMPGRKRVLSITRALQNILDRDFPRAPDAVIFPNGVDLTQYAALPDPETARRQIGLSPSPTVMCTGHLYAGRGADLFIELAAEIPQAHFVWVGGRNQDVQFRRAQVAARELTNIDFTGFVPHEKIPLYQAAADILLMPYSQSIAGSSGGDSGLVASPMKMFDYMAAGRVIVTSDLPVIREVLGENMAVFCPPDNLASWKQAILHVLSHAELRQQLASEAQSAIRSYTWTARAEAALAGFVEKI